MYAKNRKATRDLYKAQGVENPEDVLAKMHVLESPGPRVMPGGNQVVDVKMPTDVSSSNPYEQYKDYKATWRPHAGGKFKRTGFGALAGQRDSYGRPLYRGNQVTRMDAARGLSEDVRDTAIGQLGRYAKNLSSGDVSKGSLFDTVAGSPTGSTVAGAAVGGGLAALLASVAGRFGFDFISPESAALIGAGLGGAAGYKTHRVYKYDEDLVPPRLVNSLTSWGQKQMMEQAADRLGMEKSQAVKRASMYHDPRNFILEKLQRDNELSMADKAALAGKIRNMSLQDAERLETQVRSALGIGVGAMIANYFGMGLTGMLLGAGLGAAAFNTMGFGGNFGSGFVQPNFGTVFEHGGDGFSTYNEYLKSVYY